MAPSRAPPTLTSLTSALIHPRPRPRPRPRPIPRAATPNPRLTSGTTTASRMRYRHFTPERQSPSIVSVVQLLFRSLYSTAPVKVKPHSPADGGSANESKAVDDSDSNGDAGPEPPDYLSAGERGVFETVKRELAPSRLEVQDISGGCGSMYAIEVESSRFRGMSVVRQHRLVNEVLREEIREWHGVQLKTRAG